MLPQFIGFSKMATYVGTWLKVIKPYSIPSIIAAGVIFFFGMTGSKYTNADARMTAVETRMAVVENQHRSYTSDVQALMRVACLQNRQQAITASIDCQSLIGNR